MGTVAQQAAVAEAVPPGAALERAEGPLDRGADRLRRETTSPRNAPSASISPADAARTATDPE
jgi:hypothetical protein